MRFNPGLQARLGLAFAAVAVLAVVANLLADSTVRVVVERVWNPPERAAAVVAAEPVVAPAKPPVVDIPLEVETADAPAIIVHRDELAAAIDAYARAVQARIVSADATLTDQLASARALLDRRAAEVQAQIAGLGRAQRRALSQALDELRAQSAAAITRADARRETVLEYDAALENLASGARERLDDAWRIFGRVIARQRLVELRDRVEELRQSARALTAAERADDSVVAELEAREAALAALVPERPAGKASAKGQEADWDARFRYRLASGVEIRRRLVDLDRQGLTEDGMRRANVHALLQRVAGLPERLPGGAPSARRQLAGASKAAPTDAAAVAGPPTANGPAAPQGATADDAGPGTPGEPIAAEPTVTRETADDSQARRSRLLLIALSVVLLVLTLAVCVFTVRSLMRQVARLTDGIRRVARGEAAAVATGGIRELDVVATEVNEMSRQLTQARAENLGYQRDLEKRVAERTAQLHFLAAHDPLTSLPNRRELDRLLQSALQSAAGAGRRVGVFLIDLDNFKVINDGMGHGFGDQVLSAIASRLRDLTTSGSFAARLGGDEFVMVAADASDVEAIRTAGWALVRAFQQPLQVAGRELILSVSVGASIYPDHEASAEALMRAADSALFRAKALGRSQLTLFSREMFDAAEARFSTEQSLRRALDRGEFELVYQPEVDAQTFEVKCVEALLRWRLPDGRQACPGEFLSVAEESGLITEISAWVLREAVAAAGRWHRAGWHDVRVAINVSSRQLVDLGFVPRLSELLATEGLPPTAVEIELTENVLQTGAHTLSTLAGLREIGIATALDDFGTGYSSLASLEQLPLTRVKLDRSLVASIDTNPRSAAIARSIIGLCQGLDLEITAEGVERLTQFDLLVQHPRLTLQGFLLSRPLPEIEVEPARLRLPQHLASLLLSAQETQERRALPAPPGTVDVDEERRTSYL